jgi:LysR family glycine cleavage system transcriptional activator
MDKRLKQLNHFRSFECAARHKSYSRAAEELFISQAAVSQQMRQLETSLATKLFTRQGKTMQLTENGEKLYLASEQAFNTLIKGLNSIQSEGVSGSLTITSTPAFVSLWLMPRLYKFSLKHPDINIKVLSSSSFQDLRQDNIDLAIRFKLIKENNVQQDGLVEEFIAEDYVYPVCSVALAKEMNFKEPKDLLKCWLIQLVNQGSINWEAWFDAAGVSNYKQHKKWLEVKGSDLSISAVLSGHGFTLTSQAAFGHYVSNGLLIVPFKIKHPVSFKRYLVYDPTSARQARLNVFIHWLKEEMFKEEAIKEGVL